MNKVGVQHLIGGNDDELCLDKVKLRTLRRRLAAAVLNEHISEAGKEWRDDFTDPTIVALKNRSITRYIFWHMDMVDDPLLWRFLEWSVKTIQCKWFLTHHPSL